ncbi:hypothetical protein D3C84_320040 [compost metagenome]
MKKNILAALFFAGMGASVVASAANQAADAGFEGQGIVSSTECALLADTVTLNLSKNVVGAYSCDEATSVIVVAACHKGGSRSEKQVACTTDPNDNTKFLPAGCTAATGTVPVTDYVGYSAGSNGGSIATSELGGACATGTVTGIL